MKHILIFILRVYQRFISPLFPPVCRYTPSCSQYAIEALKVHGFFKGFFMAVWRVLRCNPYSRGGHDPVVKQRTENI